MAIGGISAVSGYSGIRGIYPIYNSTAVQGVRRSDAVTRGSDGTAQATVDGAKDASASKRVSKEECQTCKERKYVDGSNEGDVSFKTPAHISPNSSAATVMSHEQEHVSNAIAEGSEANKELVSATVTLKTSVCPECGSVYVSGGTTHSTIRTTVGGSESVNPYEKRQADLNYEMAAGANFDLTA
jgi:tRNA(Ile2) C34 agmatinyltransferase TiaS